MKLAVEEAKLGVKENHGGPFGVVIVKMVSYCKGIIVLKDMILLVMQRSKLLEKHLGFR